ncbi:MAG: CRISPR-associated protein Csx19 [Thermogemmata sp.]|jgi:hypothetical protein|nr:CRISPR-associated protein Csx19 [Gemmataceae bacterium]
MSTLRAGDLTPTDLLQLLQELAFPSGEKVYCWLEAFDGWALDHWPGFQGNIHWNGAGRDPRDEPLAEVLPRVTEGRLFSPSGELKWRVLPALGERCCRVVFLGSWACPSLEWLPLREELANLRSEKTAYPLWGQMTRHTPGEWIDLRIPHRLRYPVQAQTPAQGRVIVQMQVELWKDRRGEVHFLRFCDLTTSWES